MLVPIVISIIGCSSNKLNKTVWYNVTMMQDKGIMGNVGTTLYFNTDSTFVAYKGVSIDTTVVLPPFVYVCGKYKCEKNGGRNMRVFIKGTTREGAIYQYDGTYNKKTGVMVFDIPKSNMKETYLWNPKAKIIIQK